MKEELIMLGEQQDAVIEDGLADLIPMPDKPYKARVVANLAKSVSAITALMGMDYVVPPPDGPVEQLDGELVRLLAMVAKAADDYGQPLPLAPAEVRGDNELIVITDFLSGLAKDRDFKDFLAENVEEEVEEDVEAVEEEVMDEEAFFAGRL